MTSSLRRITFKLSQSHKNNYVVVKLFHKTTCSSAEENEQIVEKAPKERKRTVVRKILSVDPNKPFKILETKDSAVAMKRYNYENKHLFGPIQFSKNNQYSEEKESNTIIQHNTRFPIVEPQITAESNVSVEQFKEDTDMLQKFDFNKILDFPLLNKVNNENSIQKKVNELNLLRKYLENKSALSMPSVSAILEKTMPKASVEALARWKQGMIERLGEEGFEQYRRDQLQRGASLHANINIYLSELSEADIHVEESNIGHWKSLKAIFPQISSVKLLEERVSHPFLCYRGVVDCFAKYQNHLVVIDWKTSKKMKLSLSSTFDNPLQIAAYVGALNFDPKFQYLANKGLIVVAYENGSRATVHFIEEAKMLSYWKEWLKRVKLFWEMQDSSYN